MTDIQIGDLVCCVNNDGAKELQIGELYTVTAFVPGSSGPRTHIRIEGGRADLGFGYYQSRFALFGTGTRPRNMSTWLRTRDGKAFPQHEPYAWARREIDV